MSVRAHRDRLQAAVRSLRPSAPNAPNPYSATGRERDRERRRQGGRERHTERGRERAQELGEEQREKSVKKSGISTAAALMAGIWFAVTFLVCGISTFASSARIYPPNEGKKRSAPDFRLHPRSASSARSVAPSAAALSWANAESLWSESRVFLGVFLFRRSGGDIAPQQRRGQSSTVPPPDPSSEPRSGSEPRGEKVSALRSGLFYNSNSICCRSERLFINRSRDLSPCCSSAIMEEKKKGKKRLAMEPKTDREKEIYASIFAPQQLEKMDLQLSSRAPGKHFTNPNDEFPEKIQIKRPRLVKSAI